MSTDLSTSDSDDPTTDTGPHDVLEDVHEDVHDELHGDPADDTYDDTVEVRRDGPLSALVGATAGVASVAYLLRALGSGTGFDWIVCLLTGLVSAVHLAAVLDARAPLMVIDHQGMRVRRGRTWHGVAWADVDRVEHRPRRSTLRDGSLSVIDTDGRALSIRLSLSTRLSGSDWHELGDALLDLSEGRTTIVEPGPDAEPEATADAVPDPAVSPTPEPEREVVSGRRTEVVLAKRFHEDAEIESAAEDEVVTTSAAVEPSDVFDPSDVSMTSTIVIDADDVPAAPVDPVVGPVLVAARQRLGLSVEQLAERTRIRPHVIDSIELDDFGPCGGDFYARGHLRTLSRVLGIDAQPLLASYDERYAGGPIDARRVFEAELATVSGGALHGGRGRLNWSVLVAAVMAAVLVWSVARLALDGPVEVADQVVLNGSPGRQQPTDTKVARVPVSFTAATGGARVIVRDGTGRVVFDENVPFNQTAELQVAPPVRVSSTDGGLVVTVDGEDQGAIGASGRDAQHVYVP